VVGLKLKNRSVLIMTIKEWTSEVLVMKYWGGGGDSLMERALVGNTDLQAVK
jgi:hypothetical protein